MITIHTDDRSTFQIAPSDQGQMIEYAYATTEGGYLRRTTDHSNGSIEYEYTSYDECEGGFEPQNGILPTSNDWRPARVQS